MELQAIAIRREIPRNRKIFLIYSIQNFVEILIGLSRSSGLKLPYDFKTHQQDRHSVGGGNSPPVQELGRDPLTQAGRHGSKLVRNRIN